MSFALIPGAPVEIRSLGFGPRGTIWAGGFGSGGLASYDPVTGAMRQVQRGTVGQADEILSSDGELWLGTYPGSNVLRYDPSKPFVWERNPSSAFALGAWRQDRPVAMTRANGRIVVGTVPHYGQLRGAITVHDPITGSTYVDRGVSGTRTHAGVARLGRAVGLRLDVEVGRTSASRRRSRRARSSRTTR